jgi:signal peptidase I
MALRQPDQMQLRYMRWPVYLLYAIASAVVQWFLPPAVLSHTGGAIFNVPSQSMSPTLLRGDVIAVDQNAYVR